MKTKWILASEVFYLNLFAHPGLLLPLTNLNSWKKILDRKGANKIETELFFFELLPLANFKNKKQKNPHCSCTLSAVLSIIYTLQLFSYVL